jgi:hypothetical protein
MSTFFPGALAPGYCSFTPPGLYHYHIPSRGFSPQAIIPSGLDLYTRYYQGLTRLSQNSQASLFDGFLIWSAARKQSLRAAFKWLLNNRL